MVRTLFLVLVSCCLVFCGTSRTVEEIWPHTNDDNDIPDRIQRGLFAGAGGVQQITETILSTARAILQPRLDGEPLKNYGGSITQYLKYGGRKQAYKDFNLFPAEDSQDFLLPSGFSGKWGMVGDTSILLENGKSRTILMLKHGTGKPTEHMDKIIYID